MTKEPKNLDAFDRTIHEPGRLLILTALYSVERMEFLRLERQWKFKQGNLSSHLRKLERAGYVAVEKTFRGKYPQTWCRLTKRGREALYAYSQLLKSVWEATELRR